MQKLPITLVSTGLLLCGGLVHADAHEEGESMPAAPVELYTCSYADGMDAEDLADVIDDWNEWADDNDITEYSAWTLVPFYASPEQEFDMIWLGSASSGEALGRSQDKYLAMSGDIPAEFDRVVPCDAHLNFSTLRFKAPPERENPNNVVLSFTDCNMADGMSFSEDVAPAIGEWASYRADNGSSSGMWVLFPSYGGGGEDFDFKFVQSYQNLEEQGRDYDQWNAGGWKKAAEIFEGSVSCDSSRVYLATNVRMAEDDE